MAPDDVAVLMRRLDEVFGLVGKIDKKLGELGVKFDGHVELDTERREIRQQTCPHNDAIRQNATDLDALAGVLRSTRSSVDDLVKWKRAEEKTDAVSESWQTTLKASWNQTIKPIILPVVIALVLFRLGLK